MTSSYGYPQQTRFEDIAILSAIVIEATTPLTIPQFWTHDSLDYRSELLLPARIITPLGGESWADSNSTRRGVGLILTPLGEE